MINYLEIHRKIGYIYVMLMMVIVRLGQGKAKAKPKAITKFALNTHPPPHTQTFEALPGNLAS